MPSNNFIATLKIKEQKPVTKNNADQENPVISFSSIG